MTKYLLSIFLSFCPFFLSTVKTTWPVATGLHSLSLFSESFESSFCILIGSLLSGKVYFALDLIRTER